MPTLPRIRTTIPRAAFSPRIIFSPRRPRRPFSVTHHHQQTLYKKFKPRKFPIFSGAHVLRSIAIASVGIGSIVTAYLGYKEITGMSEWVGKQREKAVAAADRWRKEKAGV